MHSKTSHEASLHFEPSLEQISGSIMRLVHDVPGLLLRAEHGQDPNLSAFLLGFGGWNVVNLLQTAGACALIKGLPPTHHDVIVVVAALQHYGFTPTPKEQTL